MEEGEVTSPVTVPRRLIEIKNEHGRLYRKKAINEHALIPPLRFGIEIVQMKCESTRNNKAVEVREVRRDDSPPMDGEKVLALNGRRNTKSWTLEVAAKAPPQIEFC